MLRAVKYRLYPNREQEALFLRYFSACRYVYNIALEVKIYAYRAYGKSLSEYDLTKQLTDAKKEHTWLKDFSAQTLELEIHNLDKAYKDFFNGGGFPKFKSRYYRQSCTFRQNCFIPDDNHILLPKIGLVKATVHRQLEGKVKGITISKSASGKFYGSAIFEITDNSYKLPTNGKAVGIDMGIRNLVNLYDNLKGSKVSIPGLITEGKSASMKTKLELLQAKIKRVQRHLSRKSEHRKKDHQTRSIRQEKCRIRLARLKEKEVEIRNYFLNHLSSTLTNEYDTICIEDLAVKNMTKSASGTLETPGKKVKQKSGLNRELQKASFGSFRRMLEYKAEAKGRKVKVVDRWMASSKNCSNCGEKNEKLGSKTKWTCNKCGTDHDRDHNAAKNILDAGMKASSAVLVDYSRGAERKGRIKKSAGRVSVEAITTQNSSTKNRRKPKAIINTAIRGVDGG